jgi:hypothetical protein
VNLPNLDTNRLKVQDEAMPITRLGKALEAQKRTAKESKTTNELLQALIEQQQKLLVEIKALRAESHGMSNVLTR